MRIDGPPPYSIDATEVTQEDYAQFLRCMPDVGCGGLGLLPGPDGAFDPIATPRRPVRDVSVCGAESYCAWTGGRFCQDSEWRPACDSVAARLAPAGTVEAGACVLSTSFPRGADRSPADVGSFTNCHGSPPFDRVFDIVGNVSEMVQTTPRHGHWLGRDYDSGPLLPCAIEGHVLFPDLHLGPLGFRCCAD